MTESSEEEGEETEGRVSVGNGRKVSHGSVRKVSGGGVWLYGKCELVGCGYGRWVEGAWLWEMGGGWVERHGSMGNEKIVSG